MVLEEEQQELLHGMLGNASLHFTKFGHHMRSERSKELDDLVAIGALTVEEGEEPWGWTVIYRATAAARLAIGIMDLQSKLKGT